MKKLYHEYTLDDLEILYRKVFSGEPTLRRYFLVHRDKIGEIIKNPRLPRQWLMPFSETNYVVAVSMALACYYSFDESEQLSQSYGVTIGKLRTELEKLKRIIVDIDDKEHHLREVPFPPPHRSIGCVYFIQQGISQYVKIGASTNIRRRFDQLNHGPVDLKLVGYIAVETEHHYRTEGVMHERFKNNRLRGEWFYLTRDLIKFIENIPYSFVIERLPEPEGLGTSAKSNTTGQAGQLELF